METETKQSVWDIHEKRLLDAIDEARDIIKKIVISHGGWIRVEQGDTPIRTVLVNDENLDDWKADEWADAYVHALKVNEDGDLLFFADRVACNCYVSWTDEDIKNETDNGYWYLLDWDSCGAYAHNVERILHYLVNEDY